MPRPMEKTMNKNVIRIAAVIALTTALSGCFLTKVVTTPMRIVGGTISLVGDVVSIVPGVGNTVDATLDKANVAIDTAADTVDDIPL